VAAIELPDPGNFGPFGPPRICVQCVADEFGLAAPLRLRHLAESQHGIRIEIDRGLRHAMQRTI